MLTMYPGMVNSPITELAAAIDDVQTTITVVDGTKLPDAPNLAIIGRGEDAETILYTEKTGNVLSGVVRGFQGVAKAWGQGARIARFFTEYDQRAMMQNIQENADNLAAHLNDKVAHMSDAEKNYWKDQAALLDPEAYMLLAGSQTPDWSITVPQGETWYALNLWNVKAGSSNLLFQRINDVRRPLILPAGTTLQAAPGMTNPFAYICRPASVFNNDPRYDSDPKGLYYSRLERLKSLTLYELDVYAPAGSQRGVSVTADFPTDFEKGLVVLVSNHDLAWVILDGPYTGINTLDEVSDDHQNRTAEAIMIPFKRSIFTGIRGRVASVLGDPSNFSSLQGRGAIKYFKLPADW